MVLSDSLVTTGDLLQNEGSKQQLSCRRRKIWMWIKSFAFADLFEQNTAKANTYMALIHVDVRKLWVQRQLVDLGFPVVGSLAGI
jgi:hypothetical protein